jgi:catechol-2,3-dioxygenase
MIDHVNAVALDVRDVKKCAEFYRDKIGFQLQVLVNELRLSQDRGQGITRSRSRGALDIFV